MMRRLALGMLFASACTERGTATVTLSIPAEARACIDEAQTVLIYTAPDRACTDCDCGLCFGGNVVACEGQPCVATNVTSGRVSLELPSGPAALIYDFFTGSELVASACVNIALDKDGREDLSYETRPQHVMCCGP